MSARDYLFELGCEELPPAELRQLAEALQQGLAAGLEKSRLAHAGLEAFCTPRRLAVLVRQIIARQPDLQQDRRGPSLDAAYDDGGQPTAALLGFARSVGVEPEQLERRETDKGTWLFAQVNEAGQPVEALLPGLVESALGALPIGRKMRWGARTEGFARPVHWAVSLLGKQVLPLRVFSLDAGQSTRAHRVHCPEPLHIPSADKYQKTLSKKGFVLAQFAERRQFIEQEIERAAKRVKLRPVFSEALLDELTAICEWPVAIYGRFDEQFLQLPREVLIATMQKHQKYIALYESDSERLHNGFIAIANLESRDAEAVVAGNERVIRPRLADAQFFFQADQRRTLSGMAGQLDQVLYQERLGTLAQRSERLVQLAGALADAAGLEGQREHAERAASLMKADLISDLVQELPDMQGLAGAHYARAQGEPEAVAQAIAQQYLPASADDDLPETPVGALVSLADRLDALVGLFAVGLLPRGDRDPFALRRAATGIWRLCAQFPLSLGLEQLLDAAASAYAGQDIEVSDDTRTAVHEFLLDRLPGWYEQRDIHVLVVRAVMACQPPTPKNAHERICALAELADSPAIKDLAEANKRIANILPDGVGDEVREDLLVEDAEKTLWAEVQRREAQIAELVRGRFGESGRQESGTAQSDGPGQQRPGAMQPDESGQQQQSDKPGQRASKSGLQAKESGRQTNEFTQQQSDKPGQQTDASGRQIDQPEQQVSESGESGRRADEPAQQSDAQQTLQLLAELHPAVMAFFQDVLVMDKDANLQKNRLALLKKTRELFLTVADLGILAL